MDSKLRRMAIVASMSVMLLVLILVAYANEKRTDAGTLQATSAMKQEKEQPEESHNANGQIGDDLKGFLKDSTFFDEEVNPVLQAAKENANRLSLVMTSVEKDLRVQIVDMEGNPVSGESFYVQVEGLGRYKDLDQDGLIYIGDVDAGDYYV
ncbi:MAG: hypothetical protein K6G30_06780, partial [Acetatifactor sp.]|nr:hypothetical protein [Acetatifactor sp.]